MASGRMDEAAVSSIVQEAARTAIGIAGMAYCVGSIDLEPLKATGMRFIQVTD